MVKWMSEVPGEWRAVFAEAPEGFLFLYAGKDDNKSSGFPFVWGIAAMSSYEDEDEPLPLLRGGSNDVEEAKRRAVLAAQNWLSKATHELSEEV